MMLPLLFLACDPPIAETDTPADTDTDVVDTDTSDTDTGTGVSIIRITPDDPTAFAGLTLGLFPLDTSFFAVTSETPVVTAALVDGVYEVPFTPEETLQEAPWAPGLMVSGFALVAYDGTPDAGGLVGVSRLDAVWFQGTIPQPYLDLGLHEGWNGLRALQEAPPEVGDPLAFTIDANLIPADAASVTGGWGVAVAGLTGGLSTEDTTVGLGVDVAADPWTVSVSGDPPASTVFATADVAVAGFPVRAFTDDDTSGDWTVGDTVFAQATTQDGDDVWLAWGRPASTANEAHVLVTQGGFRAGWSAVKGTEGASPLLDTDVVTLE